MKRLVIVLAFIVAFLSHSAARAQGGQALPTFVGVVTSDVQGVAAAANTDTRFCGFTVKETTGSATAEIVLRLGTSTAGGVLYPITLVSNQSTRLRFNCEDGEEVNTGIFVDWISGSVQLTLFTRRYK